MSKDEQLIWVGRAMEGACWGIAFTFAGYMFKLDVGQWESGVFLFCCALFCARQAHVFGDEVEAITARVLEAKATEKK